MSRHPKLAELPFDAWPLQDQKLWTAAIAPGDRLRQGGGLTRLKLSTHRKVRSRYANFLFELDGLSLLEPDARPSQRLVESCLRPYIGTLQEALVPQSIGKALELISMAVKAMEPDANRDVIKQVAAWMHRNAIPTSIKNGRIVSPVVLFEAGIAQMARARRQPKTQETGADYRDGFAVSLMALCPIRVGVFSGLKLRESLVRESDGIRLQVDASEMKSPKCLDVVFPSELLPGLFEYLHEFRPLLHPAASSSANLWINFKGEPLSDARMRQQFCKLTKEHIGVAISPHLFRDAAATFIYDEMPERALLAAAILQHSNFKVTQKHYIAGEQRVSALKYHCAIGDLLKSQTIGRQRWVKR